MKLLWNILLGIAAFLSVAVLLLQGFALPAITPAVSVLLRLCAAISIQYLFLRLFRKKWLRVLPILLTSVATVWGFFLYLTSPSWRNATLGLFFADYASLALGCAAVWAMNWLLPRLIPRIRKAIKHAKKRRKKKKVNKEDIPRFR